MGIFDKLFGKKKRKQSEKNIEKSPLEILAFAISDVGLWTWYNPKFPKYLQLEFNRTMLYFEADNSNNPPPNQIAILFEDIESVYSIKSNSSKLPTNWLVQFANDELSPFNIDYENFTFNPTEIEQLMEESDNIEYQFGKKNPNISESTMNFKLGFKAREVGLIITANKMKILTQSGEVGLDKIPEIHDSWWKYWENYWAHRNLKIKIPYDPICEITIPANEENIKKIMKKLKK